MYIGHAAVALALKAQEPRVPIVPLTIACYGPDWLQWLLTIALQRPGMSPYTHSIMAVLLGAGLAEGAYALLARRPGARWILLGWLLHWPADFFTGRKPVTGVDDLVGLNLYRFPRIDFALEAAVIVVGCALYARAYGRTTGQRLQVVLLAATLLVIQALMDVSLAANM